MNRKQRRFAAKMGGSTTNSVAGPASKTPFEQALIHFRAGRLVDAEQGYREALLLNPRSAVVLSNLGLALEQQGRRDEAILLFREALAIDPNHTNACINLGMSLYKMEDWFGAETAYRQAIMLQPDSPGLRSDLGAVLSELGRLDESVIELQKAVALQADFAMALANLGKVFRRLGRLAEAEAAYRRAIAAQPSSSDVHSDLGAVLLAQNRFDEAMVLCCRAIELDPSNALAYVNLGKLYQDLNRLDEARQAFEKSVAVKPDYAEAHFHIGLALLTQGHFKSAWPEYEWRWKMQDNLRHLYHSLLHPEWNGEALAGRTILLHGEQGLGDSIQFARFIPKVVDGGAQVLLAVPLALHRLFGLLRGVTVLAADQPSPVFHLRASLLSLPRIFDTTLETIPNSVPYLMVDGMDIGRWTETLGGPGLRIGLVWSGNRGHSNDHNRSLPLAALAPLFDIVGCRWFSLQKEVPDRDRDTLAKMGDRLTPLMLQDFYDTACVVSALDLVISVDTSVCHLAGALGCPTWVLLPYAPDWRWLLDREDSPWYPTARLWRQPRPGDWPSVIDKIGSALRAMALRSKRVAPAS